MPANTTPVFTLTPNIGLAAVAAANTASDGSGVLNTLFTASSNGSRLERITYTNAQIVPAASSAMVIRFFITDTLGANPRLLREVALATATRSATGVGASGVVGFPGGLEIPSGSIVKVIQSVYAGVQDLMHYVAEGADY